MDEIPTYTASEREPVRLPIWLSIIGSSVFSVTVDLLTDVPWRSAVVGLLVALGPLLFGAEIARQRSWSPASVITATVQARVEGEQAGLETAITQVRAARRREAGGAPDA